MRDLLTGFNALHHLAAFDIHHNQSATALGGDQKAAAIRRKSQPMGAAMGGKIDHLQSGGSGHIIKADRMARTGRRPIGNHRRHRPIRRNRHLMGAMARGTGGLDDPSFQIDETDCIGRFIAHHQRLRR